MRRVQTTEAFFSPDWRHSTPGSNPRLEASEIIYLLMGPQAQPDLAAQPHI